jgi:hypothetical protein
MSLLNVNRYRIAKLGALKVRVTGGTHLQHLQAIASIMAIIDQST